MKILLGLNTLFELAIAIVMIVAPKLIIGEFQGEEPVLLETMQAVARSFGIGALAIAGLSGLMMMRKLDSGLYFAGFGALSIFHLGMTVSTLFNVIDGLTAIPIVLIHAAFFLVFVSIFILKGRDRD